MADSDPLQSLEPSVSAAAVLRLLPADIVRLVHDYRRTPAIAPWLYLKLPIHFTMLDVERRHGQIKLDADRKATVPHGQLPP